MKLLTVFLLAASLPAATVTVSPEGPVSNLAAARAAVRALRQKGQRGHHDVVIRGGVYRLAETFVLTSEDSDVTYTAEPGARVIVSGGRKIEGWKKAEKGPIWTAPAPWNFRQLFVNGRRAQRARTPNNGFYRIDGDSSQDKPFLLKYRGNDVKKEWAGKGVEVIALLAWSEIRMPIAEVDEAAHTARLTTDPRRSNKEKDARYFIENAPDALDSPGEWYLDVASHTISYWPASGENPARDEIVAPTLTQLVRLDGVRDVTFRGIDFRHADWTMPPEGFADAQAAMEAPTAFEAVGTENVTIERCVFRQSGGYAVWFGRGCKRNRVIQSEVADMGAGGVKVGETQQRQNEADRNVENTVADNVIHDLGSVYPSAIGVWIGQSSRNQVVHNDIHDLYYTAISVGWTWGYADNQCDGNAIEYNHLHHIGKGMLSDMGAIYTLGRQPHTTIRNNLIHDVWSFTYGGWGIYPDEGSTGELIENNIVYRTKSAGFHQHYGRENVIRNNIFAFGAEAQLMRTRAEPHLSFTFEGNIVYFDSGALLGSNWSGEGVKMDRNVYWDARGGLSNFAGKTFGEWRAVGRDAGSVIADPLFRNAASYDFTVLPGSPVWKLGWKAIDMSTVGPRVQ
jgi:hypothetical protein